MSFVYLVALIAVAMAVLGALVEAVWSVSRKPVWGEARRTLSLVSTVERRTQSMPFVGSERRADATDSQLQSERIAA